jgi:hypothetical protein
MAITNFAQEAFRSDGDQLLVPRQKYNFTVLFDRFDGPITEFTRVSSVTAPSYSVDSQIMNQYNKKRVIQTKLNYDPVTVVFYDTYDNEWYTMMRDYLKFHYNSGNGLDPVVEGSFTTDEYFETAMGFTPNANRYFFNRMVIVQNGYREQSRETILINPQITNIQGDTLDYSASNPTMYTVTFQPESVHTRDLFNSVAQAPVTGPR